MSPIEIVAAIVWLMARLVGIGILPLGILLAAAPASGSELTKSGIWIALVENGIFYNSGQNYTNGVALVWAPGPGSTASWTVRIARSI